MPRSEPEGITAGDYLRAEIQRLGLDQVAVAEATEVSRQTINNIVNGRQDISRAMATKLARLTNRTPDFWLRSHFPATGHNHADLAEDLRDEASDDRGRSASILVNHQIIHAVRVGVLVIRPFKEKHVRFASVELTLGGPVIAASGRAVDISGSRGVTLRDGESISVATKERLELPFDHVGRVGATARLSEAGIVSSNGMQVAPGFSGHLQFCLFNAGGRTFELRADEPVVALEIARLGSMPSSTTGTSTQRRKQLR